jgi:hypothetical protein
MSNTERSFYAGLAFIALDMGIYAWRGLPSGLYDLLFHGMPMTLGLALMAPKALPMVMLTLQNVLGKFRSAP